MVTSRNLTLLRFCMVCAVLLATKAIVTAAEANGPCDVNIKGHSILHLTLIEKTRRSGVRLDNPGETVKLLAGEYRVEQVELKGGYTLNPLAGVSEKWFQVTPEGPNELIVGAPLYPTVTARRHGGFIQMDYDTVDGAGRSYQKPRDAIQAVPPPTFTVYENGKEIGSGSFEYG